MADWKFDERLKKLLTPIATFAGSALADNTPSIDKKNKTYDEQLEFIAIAEGVEIPLYIFTYNLEMTQFVYTDLMVKEGQQEIIDKSIPARHHAQFVSQQIADEGRMSNHRFNSSQEEYNKLVRGYRLATLEYVVDSPVGKGTPDFKEPKHSTPKGLLRHDVYMIEQPASDTGRKHTSSTDDLLEQFSPSRKHDSSDLLLN